MLPVGLSRIPIDHHVGNRVASRGLTSCSRPVPVHLQSHPLGCEDSQIDNPFECRPMKRIPPWRVWLLGLLSVVGCHFRAGFGPVPAGRPSVEHSLVRDTVENKEGVKTINETDKTTTTFDGGRSNTLETVNFTVTQPDGSTSRTTTQTKTDRSSNGTLSTSSTTSSSH